MPTPFEMPNGFIQSANKNTRKVVGVEKGDIVQKSALNLFEKLFASVTLPTLTGSNSEKAALVVTAITPALETSLALGAQIANMLSLVQVLLAEDIYLLKHLSTMQLSRLANNQTSHLFCHARYLSLLITYP
jgi:hypothetical protein